MPEPPSAKEKTVANDEYTYDFNQAEQILEAMDFLRQEAVKTRIPEIVTAWSMRRSAFWSRLITASSAMK